MSAVAVIIGVDDYPQQPLTSALNDALAFRRALLELELVREEEVILLTAPAQPGGDLATRESINAVLKEVHDRGSAADRFYFYYAGHGLSAFVDAAHAVTQTALVPPDIGDLSANSNLLINFDDFRSRLEKAGPREQFFFVDACRDLAFADRPANLPTLGWPAASETRPDQTSQAALFAVSQGGKAIGTADGMGVMTEHLIDAMHGRGVALDWSDELDEHVVTAESIARHVRTRVEKLVDHAAQWRHQIMLPELRPVGPPLSPVRIVTNPPQPMFTLTFDPEAASVDTDVKLVLRGDPLASPQWPPCHHGDQVLLRPRIYKIDAHCTNGFASADPAKVDLREITSAVIHVRDDDDASPPSPILPPVDEPTPGDATVVDTVLPARRAPWPKDGGEGGIPLPATGGVESQADEPTTVIELVGQDPPYRRWESRGSLHEGSVPAGSYTIRFRLGTEVYCDAEFDLLPGERKVVTPGGARSPLLAETGLSTQDGSVLISESIGPMRAGTLPTVLPLLGALPFDETGSLLPEMRPLVQPLDIAAYGDRPVRVLVAIEGSGWPVSPRDVATGVRCELVTNWGERIELGLDPLASQESGWGRVVHGTGAAPGRSFRVCLRSPYVGTIELAAAALQGRITVIALSPTPDGRIDADLHLLRVPGRGYSGELTPWITYDRFVRDLALGQRLYGAGELVCVGADVLKEVGSDAEGLRELLRAKWTDPVLGCMAYLAWTQALTQGSPAAQEIAQYAAQSALNLKTYFSDLPDARVISALAGLDGSGPVELAVESGELPVLAQTLRAVAGAGVPIAREWAATVAPESSWTLVWQANPDAATATAAPDGVLA
jgi:Caspase domain